MSSLASLQSDCRREIEHTFRRAEQVLGVKLTRVPVVFTNRMKKTAGMAMFWRHGDGTFTPTEIRLSNTLLVLNREQFVKRTPAHEAAHIIAMQVYQHSNHGEPWQKIMRILGQEPERYHRMQTAITKQSKIYIYKASCGSVVNLKRGRHSRIQKGSYYTLLRTGGKIDSSGYMGVKSA